MAGPFFRAGHLSRSSESADLPVTYRRDHRKMAIIDDVTFGRQIKKVLLKDFANSRRVTVEGHERRGLIARFLEKVINLFGWFL